MIASPLRPRHRQESGIAAAGQLAHRGTPYGASLSFATTTHLWPLPDPPSRKSRSATSRTGTARSIPGRALASSVLDSPCQGSRTGLTPPISTSVPSTPTTPSRYARRLRDDGRASPEPPLRSELVRSDRPRRYLAPRPVSTTNSHPWWTDKRGPVNVHSANRFGRTGARARGEHFSYPPYPFSRDSPEAPLRRWHRKHSATRSGTTPSRVT